MNIKPMNIEEKEMQLNSAQSESDAWNKGKYKTSSNAQLSIIFVKSLQKEISLMKEELSILSE